jgi:hypothetical protein
MPGMPLEKILHWRKGFRCGACGGSVEVVPLDEPPEDRPEPGIWARCSSCGISTALELRHLGDETTRVLHRLYRDRYIPTSQMHFVMFVSGLAAQVRAAIQDSES